MQPYRILTCLLIAPGSWPLAAQQKPAAFAQWNADTTSVAASHGDYRYEGLIFGGVTLGAVGAWVGSRLSEACIVPAVPGGGGRCGSDRLGNAVLTGLAGAALGAGLGYLVGRYSPKRPRPSMVPATPSPALVSVPDSVRRRVGYQHWKGAAVGGVVGAVLGTAMATGVTCSDCSISTGDRVEAALVVSGVGAVAGFLAGLASPKYVWERAER